VERLADHDSAPHEWRAKMEMKAAERAQAPTLVRVAAAELPVLRRVFEFYLYDFSESLGLRVRDDGGFVNDEKWEHELARPNVDRWLVRVGQAWAGLAIVAHESWLDGQAGVHDVDEFFVMRWYRRHGVGRQVATRLFETYPGPWEVRVLESNHSAAAFWRSVIAGYTSGRFAETPVDSPRWKGPVFSFSSSGTERAG
jgi:predicted acetyltransferase